MLASTLSCQHLYHGQVFTWSGSYLSISLSSPTTLCFACVDLSPMAVQQFLFFFLILFIYLFIFGCIGSSWQHAGLSLVAASRGYSSLQCTGFSLQWLLLLWSTDSRRVGFSSCGMQAQYLWRTGLVAPQHVGSSWTRARTCVPCIGRRILNHCATREAPSSSFYVPTIPICTCLSYGHSPPPHLEFSIPSSCINFLHSTYQ